MVLFVKTNEILRHKGEKVVITEGEFRTDDADLVEVLIAKPGVSYNPKTYAEFLQAVAKKKK